MMHPTRKAIIDSVRACIGTPFKHQGRHKGVGLDCVGLVRWPVIDVPLHAYTAQDNFTQYGRSPVPSAMGAKLAEYFVEIPIADAQPGDILWFKVRHDPQHLGILTDTGTIIHAIANGPHKVVEHILDARWKERIVKAYQYKGVND
jgi:NlpC/P60 family putative phage cell wall peptidase